VVANVAKLLIVPAGLLLMLPCVTGCRAIDDPTESITGLTLRNDLGVTVGLAVCDDDACHGLVDGGDTLAPGRSLPVNVSIEGVPTPYRIDLPDGRRLCLKLVVHGIPRRSTVPLSAAHECGP
jgi:hypothetical protein